MTQTIVIQPVSRIEGHAKVTIRLDDAGNVSDTMVNVVELRGFEKFCLGRPVEEMPRITTSICGVCPWSHHLASAKACDAVFGVEIPPAAKKLRTLGNSIAYMEEHILHFFFLSAPDFVMGPGADYSVRNVFGIAEAFPEIGKQVVHARHLGARMLEILAVKPIHPVAAVPGGFAKPLTADDVALLKPMAREMLEFARFSIQFAKTDIFPKYAEAVERLGVIRTAFLGTVRKDGGTQGALELYDGELRMMNADGTFEDFRSDQYTDYIAEHVEPWSYLKFPYMKRMGALSMDLQNPVGVYRTNTLARLNVADFIDTPLAQQELEEYRSRFGRPVQNTLLYHWARLIELLYNAENTVRLLEDLEITSADVRRTVEPRAARGVGCVEAPRGTLIHDYETDANGLLTDVNLIVGTTHNNAPINMSVRQVATDLIKDGKYDEEVLNKIEMAIRAYDPCLSCATHRLNGALGVAITIVNSKSETLGTLCNF